jgi:hypothetical protein
VISTEQFANDQQYANYIVILIVSNVILLVIDRSNRLSNGAKSTTCPKDGALYTAVFSLFLSSISGNSGQLLFILRPAGQPFSRPSSHLVKYAPKGWPQHVCIDSHNVFLISHHFHIYTSSKAAALHPVENAFIFHFLSS